MKSIIKNISSYVSFYNAVSKEFIESNSGKVLYIISF